MRKRSRDQGFRQEGTGQLCCFVQRQSGFSPHLLKGRDQHHLLVFGLYNREAQTARTLLWIGSIHALSMRSGSTWPGRECLSRLCVWIMPLAVQNPLSSTPVVSEWSTCPQHRVTDSACRSGSEDLEAHYTQCSMGRVGTLWERAPAERTGKSVGMTPLKRHRCRKSPESLPTQNPQPLLEEATQMLCRLRRRAHEGVAAEGVGTGGGCEDADLGEVTRSSAPHQRTGQRRLDGDQRFGGPVDLRP